jgi:uncharacterized surface protein with fasciclin (FAS1) repeats
MLFRSFALAISATVLVGCASMTPKNIPETIAADPNLSTLNKLVTESGLASTLAGPGPFTVFAPNNDAFKKVPAKTLDQLAKDPKMLQSVLTYHVVPAKAMASDVKQGNVKTVNGADVPLSRAGGFVTVDTALVTQPDITATNGVIHVIDSVLLPPPAR